MEQSDLKHLVFQTIPTISDIAYKPANAFCLQGGHLTDKDQVLPVKTPVWLVKKKEEREKKEKKVYVKSEFQQENFIIVF